MSPVSRAICGIKISQGKQINSIIDTWRALVHEGAGGSRLGRTLSLLGPTAVPRSLACHRESHASCLPGPGQSRLRDTIGDVTANPSIYMGLMEAE